MNKAGFILMYCEGFSTEKLRVLMSSRWNGGYGFIGGVAKDGETSFDAVIREVEEEVGYDLTPYKDSIKPFISTTSAKGQEIDSFILKLPQNEVRYIMGTWFEKGKHSEEEMQGLCAVVIDEKTISRFLKNNIAGTTKDELLYFLDENKISYTI